MKHSHHFEYGRVILSPLMEEDIEELRVLRNKEKLSFFTRQDIDRESQRNWYNRYLQRENDIMFKITHRDNPEEFIGAIAVYDINKTEKTAEVGRTVVDKSKMAETGIGLEATKGICLFSFVVLGVERITAQILKSNERILKVDTRAGFYIVGDHDDNSFDIEMTRFSINLFA